MKRLPLNLNEVIVEGGENLSQGEKQLLCIARSLLTFAKIIIMDEATSACDPFTDDIIQSTLKDVSDSRGCTVLTIAHRLHTIVDYDKILVMSKGEVCEFGPPQVLLSDDQSEFSKMMSDYNVSHSHD